MQQILFHVIPATMHETFILACGVVNWQNPKTGQKEKVVVTAGGINLSSTSTEILFLNNIEDGWKIGPELLHGLIYNAKIINYKVLVHRLPLFFTLRIPFI